MKRLILIALCSLSASAFAAKVSENLYAELSEGKRIPVIVKLKAQADLSRAQFLRTKLEKGAYVYQQLTQLAISSQAELVALLDSKEVEYERFYISNMIALYDVNRELVDLIAARSDVAKVYSNGAFSPVPEISIEPVLEDLVLGVEPAIESTGAVKVWEELLAKGQNIVVAGQDTGVQWDHPALKRQYRGNLGDRVTHDYNWYDAIRKPIDTGANPCGRKSEVPCDDHGHGTHTVGTIVGDDGGANKIGMAPDAKWIACRNMDNGVGRPTTYIACYQFFLAPHPVNGDPLTQGRPEYAPHVINNSWGCPESEFCEGDEMVEVLQSLYAAGIVNVVSAGNEGPRCSTIETQPATITDYSFTVGALNHRNDKIAFFSSRGPSTYDNKIGPDITAPGVQIRSAVPGSDYQGGWSGTSMAGPHVAGAVALLLSVQGNLVGDVNTVQDLLRVSAIAKTSNQNCGGTPGNQIPNNTFGHGKLDIYKAAKSAISE